VDALSAPPADASAVPGGHVKQAAGRGIIGDGGRGWTFPEDLPSSDFRDPGQQETAGHALAFLGLRRRAGPLGERFYGLYHSAGTIFMEKH
jgi:hypothetical protein